MNAEEAQNTKTPNETVCCRRCRRTMFASCTEVIAGHRVCSALYRVACDKIASGKASFSNPRG